MAATVPIKCPVKPCQFQATIRYDPGIEDDHPILAEAELKSEHPDHSGRSWSFVSKKVNDA